MQGQDAQLRLVGQRSLARFLLLLHRSFISDSVQQLAERGHERMGLAHVELFANLDREGTRITLLAARTGKTKQYMGRLVGEMETAGYVTTMTDPADRRATLVKPTERGWQFMADAYTGKQEIEAAYTAILGEEQMAVFLESMELLILNGPLCRPGAKPLSTGELVNFEDE